MDPQLKTVRIVTIRTIKKYLPIDIITFMLLFNNKIPDRLIFNTCVLVLSFNKTRSLRSHTSYRHKSPHPSVKKGDGVEDRILKTKNFLKKNGYTFTI